jgi:hypothetical protein
MLLQHGAFPHYRAEHWWSPYKKADANKLKGATDGLHILKGKTCGLHIWR